MNGYPTFWFDANDQFVALVVEMQTEKGNPLSQRVGIALDHGTPVDMKQAHVVATAVAKLIAPGVHCMLSRQITATVTH